MARQLTLRASKQLHEQLVAKAAEEGVSLNFYCNMLLIKVIEQEKANENNNAADGTAGQGIENQSPEVTGEHLEGDRGELGSNEDDGDIQR